MSRQKIILLNRFHHTYAALYVDFNRPLSRKQIQRCRRTLCGVPGCLCGGELKENGPQEYDIACVAPGKLYVRPRQ